MRVLADARALPLREGCVQCVVTSPPYWGLRDYGHGNQIGLESSPDAYVASLVAVFSEVWRVLKDDGTVWLNLGDSYWNHSPVRTSSAGAFEKVFTGGKISDGPTQRRRANGHDTLKMKDLVGIPWRVAFALQADGWYLRQDIIWHKPNPMPESVQDRCTKAHEYVFLLTKSQRYYWDGGAIAEVASFDGTVTFGGPAKRARCVNGQEPSGNEKMQGRMPNYELRNRRSVWTVNPQPYQGAHFAVMPEKLVEPCILAGSRPGDLILDPFCGSGTVMRVAYRFGRRGVGCDINPTYLDLARERTTVTLGLPLERPA